MFQELYHWVFSITCPSLHPSIYAHSFSYSSWETWTWVMKFYTEGNCKGNRRPRWYFDIRQSLSKSTSFFTNKTKQAQENTLLKLGWQLNWADQLVGFGPYRFPSRLPSWPGPTAFLTCSSCWDAPPYPTPVVSAFQSTSGFGSSWMGVWEFSLL